ncbi:MAG: hypothetical protein ACTSVO_09495 [Candidatus Heimdallarchaeaceae archaeon]
MFGKKSKPAKDETSDKIPEALKILVANIPDYQGYSSLEDRSDSDMAFRKKLFILLRDSKDAMAQVNELLIHSQLLTSWGPSGIVARRIEDMLRETDNTDYKYSTFFDVKSVEGEHGIDLSILYLLEIDILDSAEEFKEKIIENQVNLEEMMLDTVETSISGLMSQSTNLFNIFNERNELIRAFEKMSL